MSLYAGERAPATTGAASNPRADVISVPGLYGRLRARDHSHRNLVLGRQHPLLWPPGVPLGLAVLAIAQMGVHLVFFIHITTGPDNTNNVLALAFGILIVILVMVGSLWIMISLNANMMPPGPTGELMNMHMRH